MLVYHKPITLQQKNHLTKVIGNTIQPGPESLWFWPLANFDGNLGLGPSGAKPHSCSARMYRPQTGPLAPRLAVLSDFQSGDCSGGLCSDSMIHFNLSDQKTRESP